MGAPGVTLPNPVCDVCDYDLLFDCVHCGLCAEACPTYVVTRCEMDSPRGRIYLMKSLAEGRIELDDDAVRHLVELKVEPAAFWKHPFRYRDVPTKRSYGIGFRCAR